MDRPLKKHADGTTPDAFISALDADLEGSSKRLRADFYRCWPAIKAALEAGYSMTVVHAALVKQQLWQGHYDTFRRYVRQCRRKAPVTPARPAATPPAPRVAPKTRSNPMLERRERPAFDYSQVSEEAQRLIAPAGDDE